MKTFFFTLSLALACAAALAQDVTRTPLPAGHPVVGTWRIELPDQKCFESYQIRADGTVRVSSGAEVSESIYEISAEPTAAGFYKWTDKIVKDNGKPDCGGDVMEIGHVSINFIAMHRNGRMFLLCDREDLEACIGPFVRQEEL